MSESDDVSLLAAVLSRQSLDLNTYATFLLESLSGALPSELVTVQRKSGLFGRSKPDAPILCVAVRLDDQRFVLQRPDPTVAPTSTIAHEVGGIVLKTDKVALDEWTSRLATALTTLASSNAATAAALFRITQIDV